MHHMLTEAEAHNASLRRPGVSLPQDLGIRLRSIPEAERNAWERQFIEATSLLDTAAETDTSTLEGAARFATYFLAAKLKSDTKACYVEAIVCPMTQAVGHVRRFTASRFFFSLGGAEISFEAAEEHVKAGSTTRLLVGVGEGEQPDVSIFTQMTAQELAVIFLAFDVIERSGHAPMLWALANFLKTPSVLVHMGALLPQLALMEPIGLMSTVDWEGMFSYLLCNAMQRVARDFEHGTDLYLHVKEMTEVAAKEVIRLWPTRLMSYSPYLFFLAPSHPHSDALKTSRLVYEMGDAQGNDYASALGRWSAAFHIIHGGNGSSFKVGTVRRLVKEAALYEVRLEGWGCLDILKAEAEEFMGTVNMILKEVEGMPSFTRLRSDASEPQPAPAVRRRVTSPHLLALPCPAVPPTHRPLVHPNRHPSPPEGWQAAHQAPSGSGPGGRGSELGVNHGSNQPITRLDLDTSCPVHPCAACGLLDTTLKRCNLCRAVCYCSKACQVKHWKEGGHKQECKRLVALAAAGEGQERR